MVPVDEYVQARVLLVGALSLFVCIEFLAVRRAHSVRACDFCGCQLLGGWSLSMCMCKHESSWLVHYLYSYVSSSCGNRMNEPEIRPDVQHHDDEQHPDSQWSFAK
jgi:hypothetical protein